MNEGIANQLSVAVETTYGTAVAPTFSVPILPSDGIRTEQELVGVEAIDTSPAKNKGFVTGIRNYPGSFELNAYPNALGFFLLSALGSVASDEVFGETAVFEHVFTETIAKKSLTIEQVIGSISERYAGYIASGFSLEFAVGQPLSISTEGKAKTVADSTKITPAYETLDVLKWDQITALSIDGVDLKAFAESGSLEYTNGLEVFHGFSANNEPSKAYVTNSDVSGSFTLFLDGSLVDALLDKFRDGNEMPIVITAQGQSVGDAAHTSLQITIPRAAINTFTTQLDTNYNQVTIDWIGAKHATNGLIEVTLVNTYQQYVA